MPFRIPLFPSGLTSFLLIVEVQLKQEFKQVVQVLVALG
jgi:hypothetical protein